LGATADLQGADTDQPLLTKSAGCNEQLECQVVIKNYRADGTMFWNELTVSCETQVDAERISSGAN